jgi:hypothetical protein
LAVGNLRAGCQSARAPIIGAQLAKLPHNLSIAMTHKAKIDWWIAAALALAIFAPLIGCKLWITIPLFLGVGICGYPQAYRTTEKGLIVRAGLIERVIPYEAVTFVGPSDDGGFAFEHVAVRYGANGSVVIAPADYRAFLDDMAAHAKHLTRRGRDLALALA